MNKMEYRRKIAVVYTAEEALEKVNMMRQHGFSEHEIHLFSKDIRPLQSLKMYTDIDVHQAGNLVDKILSLIWQMPLYEVCLRLLRFSDEERFHYGQLIEKGAIFMIAQHEFPFEKQESKALGISKAIH